MRLAPLVSRTSDTPRPVATLGSKRGIRKLAGTQMLYHPHGVKLASLLVTWLLVSWVSWPSQPLGKAPLCSRLSV